MEPFVIEVDDPRRATTSARCSRRISRSPEASRRRRNVHALDHDGLLDPTITFFSVRADGELLGVGALKQLDPEHAELKSMHTAVTARCRGVGRALVDYLLEVAIARGVRRVSLETGAMEAFAPARRLYARAGFVPCPPFGDYSPSRNSTFMTLVLV